MQIQPEDHLLYEVKTVGLFLVTALAEIVGCYLPYLWLREGKSIWLLLPAAISLAAFAWLLSLHPAAAGRVYAAYGGVYIFMAILWLLIHSAFKRYKASLWDSFSWRSLAYLYEISLLFGYLRYAA